MRLLTAGTFWSSLCKSIECAYVLFYVCVDFFKSLLWKRHLLHTSSDVGPKPWGLTVTTYTGHSLLHWNNTVSCVPRHCYSDIPMLKVSVC